LWSFVNSLVSDHDASVEDMRAWLSIVMSIFPRTSETIGVDNVDDLNDRMVAAKYRRVRAEMAVGYVGDLSEGFLELVRRRCKAVMPGSHVYVKRAHDRYHTKEHVALAMHESNLVPAPGGIVQAIMVTIASTMAGMRDA